MLARIAHRGLILLLCLAGILMVIAMIPLVALILLGMLIFALTGQNPRESTRRVALATNGTSSRLTSH